MEQNPNNNGKKKRGIVLFCLCGVLLVLGILVGVVIFPNLRTMSNLNETPEYIDPNCPECDKPVIYLYSDKEMNVDITINNVDFFTTYPKYENGWSVLVSPDGIIRDKAGREYNYLYWEGIANTLKLDMSKGFVVEKSEYINFFESKLSEIGLTDKEAGDFITYWLPYCNEFEYIQVSFQMENYEESVNIDYSVEPMNELRVFVAFKGLNEKIEIEEQDLSYYSDFNREGFVSVEWGGTFIN